MTDIWDKLEEIIAKGNAEGIDTLSQPERAAYTLANLDAEVPINGLLGYYSNSAGNHAIQVVDALRIIGCSESAELIAQANNMFPDGFPISDWDQRLVQMENLSESQEEQIDALGEEFLERPDDLGDKFELFMETTFCRLETIN